MATEVWIEHNAVLMYTHTKKGGFWAINYFSLCTEFLSSELLDNALRHLVGVICARPGVGLNDPDGSLPTLHIL